MEDWQKKEGLIPEKEPYKKGRGFVLWLVLAVASYYIIFNNMFTMIMSGILSKYGASSNIPPVQSVIYYIVCPIAKYVCAILFAFIGKGVINAHIKSANKKIMVKNAAILDANESDDYGMQEDMNPSERLIARLTKGKMELIKYEPFLKKKDFYHSFYYWNIKRALIAGVVSLIVTGAVASVIVWVMAIALDIGYAIAGQTPDQAWWVSFLQNFCIILTLVMGAGIFVASFPFAAICRKKADKLQDEDDANGYTDAINRVIPDVPMRYRRMRLMNKLIHITKKKNYTTVDEAIQSYERGIMVKKGVAAAIMLFAMFGISNAINNAMDDFERNMKGSADDVCRRMDESRAQGEAIREAERMRKQRYDAYGAARQYADNSAANAAKLQTSEAAQYANQAKKFADDLQRKL